MSEFEHICMYTNYLYLCLLTVCLLSSAILFGGEKKAFSWLTYQNLYNLTFYINDFIN